MATGGAIEPVTTIFALGVGKALAFFALGAHAVHFAVGDIVLEYHATLCTNLGITAMVRRFAARCRANIHSVTGITPVLTAGHFFTNGTLFHQDTSTNSMSANIGEIWLQERFSPIKIIICR